MGWEPNDDIARVLVLLEEHIGRDRLMLVGARCRDLHQRRFRCEAAVRVTKDIDMALAVSSWSDFRSLKAAFPTHVKAWQQILVKGVPIDLIPFGEIEDPPDEIKTTDGFTLNVAGVQEVFDSARPCALPDGTSVKLPTVPGFAALKLHAWLDRWPNGQYKDATDLALVLAWYETKNSLWDRYEALGVWNYLGQEGCMAAYLLGVDVAQVLGKKGTEILRSRFDQETSTGFQRLAEVLVAPGEHKHSIQVRQEQVQALLEGLRAS